MGGKLDKLKIRNPNIERLWSVGFSPHAVTGNINLLAESGVYLHEIHHLWHSRTLNSMFILNYGLQGMNSLLLGGDFFDKYNYYEDFIKTSKTNWWQ